MITEKERVISESDAAELFKNFIAARAVEYKSLERISQNADAIRAKAMELTDSWAGVMFRLTSDDLEKIAIALGFNPTVAAKIHDEIAALDYAMVSTNSDTFSIATYHSLDVSFLALRGLTSFDHALSRFNDGNIEAVLDEHQDTFKRVMESLPTHAARMNFKPETAADVLSSLGADISADVLYRLASKYDTSSVVDLEGRRGVTVEFIRSVTLTLAATL
ncbi:MAG TPA: hypothetical protein VEZ20_02940 [Allosphingosinicella sp.]|jgi:succinate dehydrogenase flavin-adding protein (antitoxin of CptAB toxin-antitoxin module)|nr:hypothetical protein [Allosphingosinicella sp.]